MSIYPTTRAIMMMITRHYVGMNDAVFLSLLLQNTTKSIVVSQQSCSSFASRSFKCMVYLRTLHITNQTTPLRFSRTV